jgi:molybdopterin/thiamine biosynthesis adenylyltransferase
MTELTEQQLLRYSRQLLLPQMDEQAQQKLLSSKVLIVGLGGLGSPVAMYLAAAGIGELWLADGDVVDVSNLQRQIIHSTTDIDRLKVASAAQHLRELNPEIKFVEICEKLAGETLQRAVAAVDVVVDCSDNFATRFAINQACVEFQKPLVSGAAIRGEGQLAVFDARDASSPCYRCVFDESVSSQQQTCAESGVLGPLVGVIGSMQALAVLKLIAPLGNSAVGKLQLFDALAGSWRELQMAKDPACPVCGKME